MYRVPSLGVEQHAPEVGAMAPARYLYCPTCCSNAAPEVSDSPSENEPGIYGGVLHL